MVVLRIRPRVLHVAGYPTARSVMPPSNKVLVMILHQWIRLEMQLRVAGVAAAVAKRARNSVVIPANPGRRVVATNNTGGTCHAPLS